MSAGLVLSVITDLNIFSSVFFQGQVFWRHNGWVSLFCLFSSPAQGEQEQRERAHRLREPEVKGRPFNGEVQTLLKANRSAKVSLMPSRNVPIKTALPHAQPHIKEHNKYLIRLIDAEACICRTERDVWRRMTTCANKTQQARPLRMIQKYVARPKASALLMNLIVLY